MTIREFHNVDAALRSCELSARKRIDGFHLSVCATCKSRFDGIGFVAENESEGLGTAAACGLQISPVGRHRGLVAFPYKIKGHALRAILQQVVACCGSRAGGIDTNEQVVSRRDSSLSVIYGNSR